MGLSRCKYRWEWLFNATAAQQDLFAPQSTAPTTTSTVFSTSTTTSVSTCTPNPSASCMMPTPTSVSTSSRLKLGATIGDVVGGVAGLVIIATGAMLFVRQRARSHTNSDPHEKPSLDSPAVAQIVSQYGLNGILQDNRRASFGTFYNPDNPSTFPSHVPSSHNPSIPYIINGFDSQPTFYPTPHGFQASGTSLSRPGSYAGAPEV